MQLRESEEGLPTQRVRPEDQGVALDRFRRATEKPEHPCLPQERPGVLEVLPDRVLIGGQRRVQRRFRLGTELGEEIADQHGRPVQLRTTFPVPPEPRERPVSIAGRLAERRHRDEGGLVVGPRGQRLAVEPLRLVVSPLLPGPLRLADPVEEACPLLSGARRRGRSRSLCGRIGAAAGAAHQDHEDEGHATSFVATAGLSRPESRPGIGSDEAPMATLSGHREAHRPSPRGSRGRRARPSARSRRRPATGP